MYNIKGRQYNFSSNANGTFILYYKFTLNIVWFGFILLSSVRLLNSNGIKLHFTIVFLYGKYYITLKNPYTFYGHCYSKFNLSDCIFFLLNAYIPKIWSPLQKSVQFSSICMRSSQSCPFLLHYRSYTISSLDRCISFCEKGREDTRTTQFSHFCSAVTICTLSIL